MSILDKAEVKDLNKVKPIRVILSTMELTDYSRPEVCHSKGYRLQLKVFAEFWATGDKEYEYSLEKARKQLIHVMYEDTYRHITELRNAVFSRQEGDILTQLDKLEESLGL